MWEFDILSSATSQAIPPRVPDNVLPPVDLHPHHATECNCFNLPINPVCLVDINTHRMLEDEEMMPIDISGVDGEAEGGVVNVDDEMEEIQQLTKMLDVQDAAGGEEIDDDQHDEDIDGDGGEFDVVGSWQEQRYQGALAICMWRKSANKELVFKVEHEPDNVRDKNALKFLVFHNEKWHLIGYCGVNKIPKLKRALHQNEVHSISLHS